jgi:hypothetical protein
MEVVMNSTVVLRLEEEIGRLSFPEQVWLMERLARRIHASTVQRQEVLEGQLQTMADDPDIQRELHMIEAEFAGTESDGLAGAR